MAAPPEYELECGHCGSAFTLEAGAVARQVRCPVCGGSLTVAVPIPVVPVTPAAEPGAVPPPTPAAAVRPLPAYWTPAAPPPESEPAPVPAPGFPALSPAPPDLSDLNPALRARYLRPPWPAVRNGLGWARLSAYVALPIYGCFLVVGLVVAPVVPAGGQELVARVLVGLTLIQVVPMLIHTIGQIECSSAPASYGGALAAKGAFLMGSAAPVMVGSLVPDLLPAVAVCGGVLLLLSFALWLRFLGRLGQRLGDRALVVDTWSFGSWLWIGSAAGLFLLGGAVMVTAVSGIRGLGWLCRAGTGAIGLLLLAGYPGLLRTASVAVARRGPVEYKP